VTARNLLAWLFLGSAAAALHAQSVHWDPPGGTLPVGQTSQLQLVFEDCSPQGTPAVPKVDGLTFEYVGQSSNLALVNGDLSRSTTLSYAALLGKKTRAEIPAFDVETSKGRVRVAAARFDPAGATVGGSGVALDEVAASRLTPSSTSVWAGEIFDLGYTIDVAHGYYPDFGRGNFDWNPSPLLTEDWSQPAPFESRGSEPRNGLAYHTRAIARTPGRFRLNPVNQLVNLSVGVSGFGFFQQRQYQQFSVASNAPTVEVRPLPPAPPGFAGTVGAFTLQSHVVPAQVAVGEPVTWTVELSGKGNWPDIVGLPSREVSDDFQVVQPKPKRTMAEGKRFEGTLTEDVVLVPSRPGTYALAPVHLVIFNPETGKYETLTAPGATVTVSAAAAPAIPGAGGGANRPTAANPGAPAITTAPSLPAPRAPAAPAVLPRDPLPVEGPASAPWQPRPFAAALAAPFVALAALWLGLAWRRARQTDLLNPQRAARLRLRATLASLRGADPAARSARLLDWQHDAAILWQIGRAAPGAEAFTAPAWSALWREADGCLYGAEGALPPDWLDRADAALAAKPVPRRNLARLFLPNNLLPFVAAVLGLLALSAGPSLRAADAGALYYGGDFAGAEKAWRQQLGHDPLDPAVRHNLSLALAQQDRWGEAAAQAAAAWCQRPSDPAIQAQLALACTRAGFVPEPLAAFLAGGPRESLARVASPADWQRWMVVGAAFAALGLAGGLVGAHRLIRGAWLPGVALGVVVLGVLLGLAGWLSMRAYGVTADDRAAIVWRPGTLRSIPTEADVSQKTTPLLPGSTAIIDRTFLGWVHLRFPSGPTGWVRQEEVVRLWR
jgi:hypothetical protein